MVFCVPLLLLLLFGSFFFGCVTHPSRSGSQHKVRQIYYFGVLSPTRVAAVGARRRADTANTTGTITHTPCTVANNFCSLLYIRWFVLFTILPLAWRVYLLSFVEPANVLVGWPTAMRFMAIHLTARVEWLRNIYIRIT